MIRRVMKIFERRLSKKFKFNTFLKNRNKKFDQTELHPDNNYFEWLIYYNNLLEV